MICGHRVCNEYPTYTSCLSVFIDQQLYLLFLRFWFLLSLLFYLRLWQIIMKFLLLDQVNIGLLIILTFMKVPLKYQFPSLNQPYLVSFLQIMNTVSKDNPCFQRKKPPKATLNHIFFHLLVQSSQNIIQNIYISLAIYSPG